jgi:FAD/FMN-containing dehydrogenase
VTTWSNWVGNQSFDARRVVPVADESAIQAEVRMAREGGYRVRTYGTGHSFTPIVESDVLLDTAAMRGICAIDEGLLRVRALPKTAIGDFGKPLWERGLALANQGDIDTQAIAGAIATATHGSGRRLPNFSATLTGARIVDGNGDIVIVGRDHPDLPALQTSIGLLGIMTELEMQVVPAYQLAARTDIIPFDAMLETFEHDIDSYRHYGLFWMPTDESARLYNLHDAAADDCVVKRYLDFPPATDRESLPEHHRYGTSFEIYPMIYDPNFHEVEYFLPLSEARSILTEMRELMRKWLPLSIYPLEIRVVAADDAWLSPNYERENLVVSISGEPGTEYWPYLRACDDLFASYEGRPHWGKIHFMTAERIAGLLPRYEDFLDVRRRYDPDGLFLNDHLGRLFE